MLGRKIGMMRLYDGAGRVRAVTVIEVGPNRVTQVRTTERDGYEAVQLGFTGARKRVNRPERGHLRRAGIEETLTELREFPTEGESYTAGQTITVDAFTPGEYVNVAGVSKGRGWAGGVKRWHFRGGPKTHGQSDRHRAPGSVGSGTTPGKVWKGQKMAGHMGDEVVTVLNCLVVATDPERNLLFVQGSVPGPRTSIVSVRNARRPALKAYVPPVFPTAEVEAAIDEAEPVEDAEQMAEQNAEAGAEQSEAQE